MKKIKKLSILLAAAVSMAVSGCGTAPANSPANQTTAGGTGDKDKTVTFGYMNWDEAVAVTFLWQRLLEQHGYTVNLQQMGPGPVWQGLDTGALDVFMDTWMPYVDKNYMDKYGSQLVNLGQWYGGTTQEGFVVPDYMSNIKTMGDLSKNADKFGKNIVGIESGSIEMGQAQKAIQDYNLPFTLQASSTPAMLVALQRAYQQKQPIVVTLWSPHWAFAKYHLHYIKDPKDDFGQPGIIDTVVTKSWKANHPVAAGWLKNFHLSVQQLGTLEEDISQHEDNKMAGVDEWIHQNQALVNGWFK